MLMSHQSEPYIEEANRINTVASSQASKGLTEIMNRTRALSLVKPTDEGAEETAEGSTKATDESLTPHADRPESLPADIVKEAQNIVTRFRAEAAKRLKDIERAEDAADEALLRFGTNIRSFLKDAVSIAPPTEITEIASGDKAAGKVLFESKDSEGRRTIHTSRLDAQLHVIHCNLDSFLKDPTTPDYDRWKKEFDGDAVTGKTAGISANLERYPELRSAMEKLVPEQVDYATFWRRYYFLRTVAEGEEQARKELLKGMSIPSARPY
jgi:BSD domain